MSYIDYNLNNYVCIIFVELNLIDLTGEENKWKKEIVKLSNNIKLHLVRQGEDILYPWLMICNAKINCNHIDVTESIPDTLPHNELPGMKTFEVIKKIFHV